MTKKLKKSLLKITELSLEVNEKTKTDIFINISGHIKLYKIYGYKDGHSSTVDRDWEIWIWIDEEHAQERADRIINKLQDILNGVDVCKEVII